MTTEHIWIAVLVTIWSIRWYLTERENARLHDKVWIYNERAHILHEFIKENTPDLVERSKQVLAEKTKWRERS